MAFRLGSSRVIKEIRIEVKENFQLSGFVDLVSRGYVKLTGTLKYLNDEKTEQITKKQKFPLIIHFKMKKTTEENNPYIENLKIFESTQDLFAIEINYTSAKMTLIGYGEPNGKWRASTEELDNVEILEARNVPGLKDVIKNGR